jgi:hypothetical protein
VLLQEHPAELGQGVRPDIVGRPEDAFAVFDPECDDLALERERLLEKGACRLVHEPYDSRTSSSGIRRPARYTEAKVPRERATSNAWGVSSSRLCTCALERLQTALLGDVWVVTTEQADGSNYRDDSEAIDESADGSNYRDDDGDDNGELADGSNLRDDSEGISEAADGTNYREPPPK